MTHGRRRPAGHTGRSVRWLWRHRLQSRPWPRAKSLDQAARAKPQALDQTQLQAAWTPGVPSLDAWTPRPWVTVEQRIAAGRAARQNVPRSGQGALDLPADRDPIAILAAQEADRLPELVPLRHARMAESGFRLLPGHPGRHGRRPRDHAPKRPSSSRPAVTPTCRISGCSPRPNASSSSMPTTSTRRCRDRGNGT